MRFASPMWLLGALFALAVGGLLVLGALAGVRALRRFGEPGPVENLLTAHVGQRRALKGALLVLSLAACFVALAQPQYGWGTRRIPATNLDVIVVLDYSKSMYARDVAPNRIERAKSEVAELIGQLPGARFGAVAFAGEPISFPLTSDGGAIAQFFRQLSPHDMPVGGTAIARALEAGRSLLERDPQSSKHRRVMLLVTDGEDLEGDPLRSAQLAKDTGVAVHVVQIGGRTPEPIPDIDESGVDRGIRRTSRGEIMTTSLSAEGERQLAQIAEITGGNVVRSEAQTTGIEEVTRRLRAMMTEELSERVETVYADVYAYPLAVALLLLLVETFLPEVRRRRRRATAQSAQGSAASTASTASTASRSAGAAHAAALLFATGLTSPLISGCESKAIDRAFTRHSPAVDRAIEALSVDAGAAEAELTDYLGISRCRDGNISVPAAAAERAQATFDLGLSLFRLAERFGGRFGVDPGRELDDPAVLARRSEEVACALTVVREVAARPGVPLELRAQAHYLLGNLEFLRREYGAAVASYDRALRLVPGDEAPEVPSVGRDAAHNRAIALRLEEENRPEPPPDAGAPQPDGGEPDEQPPQGDGGAGDPGQDDPEQQDQEREQDPSQSGQEPKPDPSEEDQRQDTPDREGEGDQSEPTSAPDQQQEPENLSLAQDEKMLDELERAPTVQQEYARSQRGRVRRVVEDK